MAAATIRASYYGGAAGEPAGATAETGITFSESDAQAPASGTAPVSIPTSTGTAFSWIMLLAFEVTGTGTTSINNRTIRYASGVTAGLAVFFDNQATYRQPASGNAPPNSGSAGPATPAVTGAGGGDGYVALTTSPQQWDNTSSSTGTTGRKGNFVELVFAVDNSYAGGGGQAALPNLTLAYDEF
jgi:hypothetical protein